jgi:hypothetical protein
MKRIWLALLLGACIALAGVTLCAGEADAGGGFPGTVANVDISAKTLAVRGKGVTVVFVLQRPLLQGYRTVGEIKRGDKVTVAYTGNGTRIMKGHVALPEPSPVVKAEKAPAGKGKERPKRVAKKVKGSGFEDVDDNEDGRISAIELCTIIPNLTREQFRGFDRDRDGFLNRSEYIAIRK